MVNKTKFKQEEVLNINIFQLNDIYHPFTCLNDGDEAHIKYEFNKIDSKFNYEEYIESEKLKGIPYPEMKFKQTSLIATENGMICPVCGYTQNWVHPFMK